MSTRQNRRERREAEREANKLASKQESGAVQAEPKTRAEINRANAQSSTGPGTLEGRAKSSQNPQARTLLQTTRRPRRKSNRSRGSQSDLRAEPQPANITEEILVNEMAEQFWRLKRMRRLEADLMNGESFDEYVKLASLIHRNMTFAVPGVHKALAALLKLKKESGFVPTKSKPTPEPEATIGFVPPNSTQPHSETAGFVPQNDLAAPEIQDPVERSDEKIAA